MCVRVCVCLVFCFSTSIFFNQCHWTTLCDFVRKRLNSIFFAFFSFFCFVRFCFVLFLHINKMMADKSNTHNVLVTFHSKCERDDDDVCSLCGNYPMIMYKFIDYVLGKTKYLHGFDLFDTVFFCHWIYIIYKYVYLCGAAGDVGVFVRLSTQHIKTCSHSFHLCCSWWSPFYLYDHFIHSNATLECDSNG